MEKIKLGISRCLLGENVRYDGGHKLDHYLKGTLGKYVEWFAICPEVDCGLTVPREKMWLVGNPESPRLVTVNTEIDYTHKMLLWTKKVLKILKVKKLTGFIFKSKSPSCGLFDVKIYNGDKIVSKKGIGLFAKEFIKNNIELFAVDEKFFDNKKRKTNFLKFCKNFSKTKKIY